MEYLFSALIGYIFGSIPTAYILLKKSKGIDITTTGSGNVGAMNSFEITGSKKIGVFVFLIDFLKGLVPVLIMLWLDGAIFSLAAMVLIFSVLSHCFNPWLMFKGGRGLATAAGGSALLFPYLPILWIVLWIIIYVIKKDILYANVFSIIFSLIIFLITYKFAFKFAYPTPETMSELILFVTSGLIIIFIKHIDPFKEIIINKFKKKS